MPIQIGCISDELRIVTGSLHGAKRNAKASLTSGKPEFR